MPIISSKEAYFLFNSDEAILLDVRSKEGCAEAYADKLLNISWYDIRTKFAELDPAKAYAMMCRGSQRASIAVSILKYAWL